MFQFTREFIINDNEGKLSGGKKFLVSGSGDAAVLYVDNMINIRKKDVNAIYKHAYEAEAKEQVEIDAKVLLGASLAEGELVRLVVTLGVQGKTTAAFNDYYPDHSRHMFYEAIVPAVAVPAGTQPADVDAALAAAAATAVAQGLKDSFDHEKQLWGSEKFMELSVNAGEITIDAPDCYTRIKEVRLVKLPQQSAAAKIGAILTGYEDWDSILDWKRKDGDVTDKVAFAEGKEGNGNTVQILKNMRLQTAANLNPYGLNMDERPLPKSKYNQYLVEIVTERRHIGHDVMGSVGTSLTSVVFYVLQDLCSGNNGFENALGALGTIEGSKASANAVGGETKEVIAKKKDI